MAGDPTTDLAKADIAHLLHPLTSHADFARTGPRVIVKGEGLYLTDSEGNRYLDAFAVLLNVNLGYGRREIAQAVYDQMAELPYYSAYAGFSNVPAIRLAEKLSTLTPPGLNAAFFTSGGSEANESAFKIARYYWKLVGKPDKVKFISRHWGYHGVTLGALSATGVPLFRDLYVPLSPPSSRSRHPTATCASSAGTSPPATSAARTIWRSPSSGTARTPSPASSPSRDGHRRCHPTRQRRLPAPRPRDLPQARHPLHHDEVITGFGRTGKTWAWTTGRGARHQTMAKGLTSAYLPLGAAVVSDRIHGAMQEIRSGVSSPTASPIPGTRAAAPPA